MVTIAPDMPPIVADRLAIDQIFGNLLDNAVKYRVRDRALRIAVRAAPRADGTIGVEIADNGRGIADADRERVFELFRRSGVPDQPGDGVGLAFVRAAMRNLGGEITLTSVLGEGTTFHLVLPRTLQTEATAEAA